MVAEQELIRKSHRPRDGAPHPAVLPGISRARMASSLVRTRLAPHNRARSLPRLPRATGKHRRRCLPEGVATAEAAHPPSRRCSPATATGRFGIVLGGTDATGAPVLAERLRCGRGAEESESGVHHHQSSPRASASRRRCPIGKPPGRTSSSSRLPSARFAGSRSGTEQCRSGNHQITRSPRWPVFCSLAQLCLFTSTIFAGRSSSAAR